MSQSGRGTHATVDSQTAFPATQQLPEATARFKSELADFVVHERLDTPLTGSGEHLYVYVEKAGCNTEDVRRHLASSYGVAPAAVGYAGRKDKHGITRQWFSVCTPENEWRCDLPDVTCIDRQRHSSKLRPGQHGGNWFKILLRNPQGWSAADLSVLEPGFANYVGEQRFGTDNLVEAQRWLEANVRPEREAGDGVAEQQRQSQRKRRGATRRRSHRVRQQESWHVSVLRSWLFNLVVHARVQQGNVDGLIDGDVVMDDVATGPLWGRGRSATTGAALDIEQQALAAHQSICHRLEFSGVQQGRRKLWVVPRQFEAADVADGVQVSFELEAGAYATTLLRQVVHLITERI